MQTHEQTKLQIKEWTKFQEENSKKVICDDSLDINKIKYIAGVDISFNKKDSSIACSYITVISYPSNKIVYQDHKIIKLTIPYVCGYLGFREVPFYVELLDKLKKNKPEFIPDIIMVDGFGILHHRGLGSASHLGIITDIPTIGIAKNLLCLDGLIERKIKKIFQSKCVKKGEYVSLRGTSGKIYGAELKGTLDTQNPIYVSIGHKISLDTAIKIVTNTCKFRVPEPIRNSDIKSKLFF